MDYKLKRIQLHTCAVNLVFFTRHKK